MTAYVTDAHALLWYLFTPEKLGAAALDAFETIQIDDLLIVPALVVAEMVMVIEKQRIQATLDELKAVVTALQQEESYLFPSLTSQDILDSAALTQIPDIFDRPIVYEAYNHNAILITKDEDITQSGLVSTIW
jgi:PIN domain nuclease of toxin-antitoxin system